MLDLSFTLEPLSSSCRSIVKIRCIIHVIEAQVICLNCTLKAQEVKCLTIAVFVLAVPRDRSTNIYSTKWFQ